MGFFDKAKAAAGQAAAKAKQSADDLQLKVDLGSAYGDLGKAAFELIEKGELTHEKLDAPAAKVRELRERTEPSPSPKRAGAAAAVGADRAPPAEIPRRTHLRPTALSSPDPPTNRRNPMLSDARYYATLPAADLERARRFYSETLGLEPAEESPAGLFYVGAGESRFLLFPTYGQPSGNAHAARLRGRRPRRRGRRPEGSRRRLRGVRPARAEDGRRHRRLRRRPCGVAEGQRGQPARLRAAPAVAGRVGSALGEPPEHDAEQCVAPRRLGEARGLASRFGGTPCSPLAG